MEKVAFWLLGIAGILWLVAIVIGFISALPYGIVGLMVIAGLGILFFKVLGERVTNEEDDYYSKNIHQ